MAGMFSEEVSVDFLDMLRAEQSIKTYWYICEKILLP